MIGTHRFMFYTFQTKLNDAGTCYVVGYSTGIWKGLVIAGYIAVSLPSLFFLSRFFPPTFSISVSLDYIVVVVVVGTDGDVM